MRRREADDLALIRRLDWRFLLSDPGLGRVAYLGPERGELRRALERFSRSLVRNPDPDSMAATFRTVVAASSRTESVRRAVALLEPGGRLYWEVDRRRDALGPTGYLRDPRRTAESLGLVDVRAHWHHPSLEESRMILPPTATAVIYALSRRSPARFGLFRLLARALPWGLLPRFVPGLSVLARRAGGPDTPTLPAAATLAGIDPATVERVPYVLLTPRFRASRHVITAFLDEKSGEAVSVAKTVRLPGDSSTVDREAVALEAAGAALPDPTSVPRVRALGECGGEEERTATTVSPRSAAEAASEPPASGGAADGPGSRDAESAPWSGGHATLVASAVDGRLLTPADFREDPERWTGAVVAWITTLHRATRTPVVDAAARWSRVEEPLRRIEREGFRGREATALIERTRTLVRPLLSPDVPAVLEHGDVSCPNILVSKTGRIGVVDWETADLTGFPGADLFFFLAFVAVSREDAVSTDQAVRAFRHAFHGADAWALSYVERYWRDMDLSPRTLPALFTICWARRLGRLSGRSSRYVRFWAEACAWAEQMDRAVDRWALSRS